MKVAYSLLFYILPSLVSSRLNLVDSVTTAALQFHQNLVLFSTNDTLNVLNASNGLPVWEYPLSDPQYTICGTSVLLFEHSTILALSINSGIPRWQYSWPSTLTTSVPSKLQVSCFNNSTILTNGHEVRRISSQTGEILFNYSPLGLSNNQLVMATRASKNSNHLLALEFGAASLSTTFFDSGAEVVSHSTQKFEFSSTLSSTVVQNSFGSSLLCFGNSVLSRISLEADLSISEVESTFVGFIDVGLSQYGVIILESSDGAFQVMVDGENQLEMKHHFSASVSTAHLSGFVDERGGLYVAHFAKSQALGLAILQIYSIATSSVTAHTIPCVLETFGTIMSISIQLTEERSSSSSGRVAILSLSSIQLYEGSNLAWSRVVRSAPLTTNIDGNIQISTRVFSDQSDSAAMVSVGRVLGNRNTLFKYLNRNLLLVVKADGLNDTILNLIDSRSGNLLTVLRHADLNAQAEVIIRDNWILITSPSEDELGQFTTIISFELFTDSLADTSSSITSGDVPIKVISRSFRSYDGLQVDKFAPTQPGTFSGAIFSSRAGHLVLIPRRWLDPCRPYLSAEENLLLYNGILVVQPSWIISTGESPLLQNYSSLSSSFNSSQLYFSVFVLGFALLVAQQTASKRRIGTKN